MARSTRPCGNCTTPSVWRQTGLRRKATWVASTRSRKNTVRRCDSSGRLIVLHRVTPQPHSDWQCWSSAEARLMSRSGCSRTSCKRLIRPMSKLCANLPAFTSRREIGPRLLATSEGSLLQSLPNLSGRLSSNCAWSICLEQRRSIRGCSHLSLRRQLLCSERPSFCENAAVWTKPLRGSGMLFEWMRPTPRRCSVLRTASVTVET
mmetsp:Transcript_9412/g.26200  ORF Transcript_9412/g.26200 Transcript_9412/m.26200 type:complete len:206 (-) Transcript_9412:2093-2710(-)